MGFNFSAHPVCSNSYKSSGRHVEHARTAAVENAITTNRSAELLCTNHSHVSRPSDKLDAAGLGHGHGQAGRIFDYLQRCSEAVCLVKTANRCYP